jgi:hypothetical protein
MDDNHGHFLRNTEEKIRKDKIKNGLEYNQN